jgi:hypothetical protein
MLRVNLVINMCIKVRNFRQDVNQTPVLPIDIYALKPRI